MSLIECPECGKLISSRSTVCINCGYQLNNNTYKTGDIISFGKYPLYSNDKTEQPIKWKVIDVKDDKMLIITEKCIEAKMFHEEKGPITWENCSLRKWLNNDFFAIAFSKEEQGKILLSELKNEDNGPFNISGANVPNTKDKIFILSKQEAYKYFDSDLERQSKVTDHAKDNGADYDILYGNGRWWLRTTYQQLGIAFAVLFLGRVGEFGYYLNDEDGCIRPTMWIKK